MPIYTRKGSPFWWMSITVPGCDRFRGSTGQTDERQARIVEAETYQKLQKGLLAREQWRVRECFGTYWTEHAQHKTDADQIFRQLELLSAALGADTAIRDITNAMIMDYRARRRGGGIVVDGKASGPVAANTVNRDLAYLNAALNWAREVHAQDIPPLAWKRLRVPEPEHRVRFAGADEFSTLLEGAHESVRPVIIAAVTTGLRKANLLKLDWHQVDLARGTITIPRSKGRKPIVVRVVPALRAALGRTPAKDRRGPVFELINFRKRWEAAVKAAGLVDFRFHDLRHTFASWARMNGADLADICEAMAHSSVSVTMRYAHIKSSGATTAFDRVGELLSQPKKRTKKGA
jgi:integrase